MFFKNPQEIIKKNILNITDQSKGFSLSQKIGCSFLLSGIIRGLGVDWLEALDIFSYVDKNLESVKSLHQKESIFALMIGLLENF